MEQARIKIAISNIIADIDRRCFDITHPVSDDVEENIKRLRSMRKILNITIDAMEFARNDRYYDMHMAERLEIVVSEIKQMRIDEYENEETEREGEKA